MSQIKRLLSLVVIVFLAYQTEAQLISVNIGVRVPPPPRHYVRPACPGSDYIWHDGRWRWDDYVRDYVWIDGYWEYLEPRYYAPRYNYYAPPRGRGRGHGYGHGKHRDRY